MNGTIMYTLFEVVHMDINVFGSLYMKFIIAYLNGALIITVDNS